jgi:hypothetical protein
MIIKRRIKHKLQYVTYVDVTFSLHVKYQRCLRGKICLGMLTAVDTETSEERK